jgi:RNase P/RNase MRP subunit POP5
MNRRVAVLIRYPCEIQDAPSTEIIESAMNGIVRKCVGEVGFAQCSLKVASSSVNSDNKYSLNASLEVEADSRFALKNIIAALSAVRALGDQRVSVCVTGVTPDL